MPFTSLRRNAFAAGQIAILALVVLAGSGCSESIRDDDEDEPQVASMRLTFNGTTTVTLTGAGGTQSVTLPQGPNTVTAVFLRQDGSPDPVAVSGVFRLEVTAVGPITFTRSGTNFFAGTLTIGAPLNSVGVQFSLYHIADDHHDFGPFTVNVTSP
jgi:hypothetical protein